MKRILYITILSLFCAYLHAQSMTVSSFAIDESDLTANLNGTTVLDQNGGKCALIRIQTTQKGFTFDVGSLGVQKVDDSKVGEVWLYVPAGVRKIDIRHQQLGSLLGYTFPVAVNAGKTYRMQLAAGNVRTIVEQDDGKTYFSLSVKPANAVVMVDGTLQSLDSDGSLVLRMNRGEHSYSVQAPGYAADNGTFTLGVQKVSKAITLQSVMAQLTLSCATPGAALYVNDAMKASGSWTGTLTAGDYMLEARKEGYYSQKQSVTLAERDNKNITLPELTARTGQLDVNYKPIDCEVYIDGKKAGSSPDVFKGILIGSHKVQLRKEGYAPKEETVSITEGQTAALAGALEKATASSLSASLSGAGASITVGSVSFTMIPVEGGTFTMGATSEQGNDAYDDEIPAHSVTLSSYYIGQTEVTQALWKEVIGSNPSNFKGDSNPVEQVSWDDCQTFIQRLNQRTGKKFRLPTEAEWEYAARGGKQSRGYKYSGSNNIGTVAWYTDNSGSKTHAVGTKSPNELGIYDMSGNVWEWCNDWYDDYSSNAQTNPTGAYSGAFCVNRGGSWDYYGAGSCRSSDRGDYTPSDRGNSRLGLRLALSE